LHLWADISTLPSFLFSELFGQRPAGFPKSLLIGW
jgi:hypothetical protein